MRIKLGGVPEHFNYLWQSAFTQELFRKAGHYIEWTDFKGGTGAMIESLEKDEVDIAIMLTEGAIAAIDKGHDSKIRIPFVISPLIWGVFSSANRVEPLPNGYENAKFAVSRKFSGSHLMSQFLASKYGSNLSDENFVVSQNLKGAIEALETGKADFFLWEKYMTLNLVEERIFNYNGQITAPWPAFVFVSKSDNKLIETEQLKELVDSAVNNFMSWEKDKAVAVISQFYGLRKEDTENWFDEVRYYDGNNYWSDRIMAAQYIMQANDMCDTIHALEDLCEL